MEAKGEDDVKVLALRTVELSRAATGYDSKHRVSSVGSDWLGGGLNRHPGQRLQNPKTACNINIDDKNNSGSASSYGLHTLHGL